jgi:hypothetical protein
LLSVRGGLVALLAEIRRWIDFEKKEKKGISVKKFPVFS